MYNTSSQPKCLIHHHKPKHLKNVQTKEIQTFIYMVLLNFIEIRKKSKYISRHNYALCTLDLFNNVKHFLELCPLTPHVLHDLDCLLP